jgi:hypothetical protein
MTWLDERRAALAAARRAREIDPIDERYASFHRPRVREARLRHREPRAGHGPPALHRGQGPGDRRGHSDRDEERDPDSLNKLDDFVLAIVEFLDGDRHRVRYVRRPFQREPDFGVTSVNYDFAELLARAEEPT